MAASDRRTEDVDVPEWGGAVRVATISGAERDQFESGVRNPNGKMDMSNIRARLVALACVDDQGAKLFTASDAAELGQKNAAALDRVFSVAMKLAGLRAEDVEDLTENFTKDPNGDSTLG